MGWPVVTVASGGMPVIDVSATTKNGMPVSEAANGFGRAVTKVTIGGIPVVYVSPPLLRADDGEVDRGRAGEVARGAPGAETETKRPAAAQRHQRHHGADRTG
jgi:phosphoglycerate dehydrogenase-like enzyme